MKEMRIGNTKLQNEECWVRREGAVLLYGARFGFPGGTSTNQGVFEDLLRSAQQPAKMRATALLLFAGPANAQRGSRV